MDFYEVVGQVLELLQRQGRVSYRALKRQFDLDDEYIEDLKEELIEAQRLAVDENGRILVWIGKTGGTSASASQPHQFEQQPAPQVTPAPQAEPPTDHRTREAERRQLTVMFCDLVDSTKLSSQLDPEDYREVVRNYQRVCTEVIQRYDGHIAQYLGDGLLVYFGYPQAHEDDAQRAIHTGLGIVQAIQTLNTHLKADKGVRLAVRLGIHTGLVVVGEMGGEGRREQLALGETPNVAARIQGLAEPNTVVISDATYRLVQGYFICQELGEQTLRGVTEPVSVYRVLSESGVQSRLDVASTRGLTPLVGREQEVGLLIERWEQAKDGQGQIILLSGEAGIGKSRLVQVLKDHVASEPHTRWECRSSPYYQNTALYPLIDLLQRALQWHQNDSPDEKLEKLERQLSQYRLPIEESVPLFAPLLSLPLPEDRYPQLALSPQRQRQKTLESIVAILLELAERQPVLFILEDLHWTDPTTLEFLGLLVEQVPTASLYTLLTCRPHFQPAWHHRSYLTEITVSRLSRDQIERMATQVAGGKMLPTEIIQQLVEKTDGVPLYVEEVTKAVLESGVLKEIDGQYKITTPLTSLSIPATLQDSLMARLDRLVSAKGIAQLGAVIGRQFSYELLHAVSQVDEDTLHKELSRLVESELLYQRGLPPQATYTFKHALIQGTAYESLLRSTRQGYHRRIAEVLEEQFPEASENQPELLAHHYTEAGLNEQAIGYWQQAGEKAAQRFANLEAIRHLNRGLALLQTLPDPVACTQQEFTMLTMIGTALATARGIGSTELEPVYIRARELCQQSGETVQLLPVLEGLCRWYSVRGSLQTALEIGQQFLRLSMCQPDHAWRISSHSVLGTVLFRLGDLRTSRLHGEQAIGLYQQHCLSTAGSTLAIELALMQLPNILWYLGYPDQALQRGRQALTFAQERANPFGLVRIQHFAAVMHCHRRESAAAQEFAETVIARATEYGFTQWGALGTIVRGWVRSAAGQAEAGILQLRQGLSGLQTTGSEISRSIFLPWLADAYSKAGHVEEGLRILTESQTLAQTTGERIVEAERHRLKGELLLQQSMDNATEAESCFHQSIAIAQNQSAKSWELRAATSLAKLWQRQGKRQEAYDLLAPVYGWFTEGFDTADLKDAKALLNELEDGRS